MNPGLYTTFNSNECENHLLLLFTIVTRQQPVTWFLLLPFAAICAVLVFLYGTGSPTVPPPLRYRPTCTTGDFVVTAPMVIGHESAGVVVEVRVVVPQPQAGRAMPYTAVVFCRRRCSL